MKSLPFLYYISAIMASGPEIFVKKRIKNCPFGERKNTICHMCAYSEGAAFIHVPIIRDWIVIFTAMQMRLHETHKQKGFPIATIVINRPDKLGLDWRFGCEEKRMLRLCFSL